MPTAARLVLVVSLLCAACGGSSSETPPPLEPLPANMHYHRAATALPGETESQTASSDEKAPEAPAASGQPEIGPAPKTWGDGTKGLK